MTPTEYQRRWRAKRQATGAAKGANRQPRMAANDSNASEDIAKAMACYEAYGEFRDDMAAIAGTKFETEQLRVTALLGAVILLLCHDLPAARSFHALHALLCDIYDLAFGGRPEFFFGASKPTNVTTKPKIAWAHSSQAFLVSAYAALVGQGCKRPAEAINWLNSALKECKLADLVGGDDIRGWYHQLRAPRGNPAPMLVERFRELQPELSGLSNPAEAEAFAMQCVHILAIAKPRQVRLRRKRRDA
jgi:hypothetical protein